MKIILKENVYGLGFKDDVVNVRDGYGRNFLIPTGKAVIASKSSLRSLEEDLKQRAHKLEKIKAEAQELADKLSKIKPITIEVKVSGNGVIYGSVNNIHIADALKEQGFEIERKAIVLKKDVKQVGEYTAIVRLHKDVSAEIPFSVIAEGGVAAEREAKALTEVEPVAEKDADNTVESADAEA